MTGSLGGEEEERRREERKGEERKNFNSRVLEFSSSRVDSLGMIEREAKTGEERRIGDRKEARRRSERSREEFHTTNLGRLGGRKKAKNRRRKGSFSLLGQH